MEMPAETVPGPCPYRMPAEWEPHRRTWLAWPHKEESWPGLFERIPAVWVAMIDALRESEEVGLLACDEGMEREIARRLGGDLCGVRVERVPTNDAWARDYGPTFVRTAGPDGRLAAVEWTFNSWGGKYPPWDADAAVPAALGRILGISVVRAGMVLEGGSIDVDGEGTLLTTESCLLNAGRNPELDRGAIEDRLRRLLGVDRILWLGSGICGDDTDGHVDDLTRFVVPGRVVAAVETDPRDKNHRPLAENRERLGGMRDARGRRLEVVEIPMPPPIFHEGYRCPASYANFYIANGVVLVPTFASERDAQALGILSELFPGRKTVGIDCRDLVWGLGALHCVSQQEPA